MKQSDTKVLPSEIKKYLDEGYKLVDIREQAEMDGIAKLDDAMSIPLSALLADPRQYFTDPNEKILLICRTGKRSKALKKKMYEMGYTDVKDVCGGMTQYNKEMNEDK